MPAVGHNLPDKSCRVKQLPGGVNNLDGRVPRIPMAPNRTLWVGKMEELRLETGNLRNPGLAICFPIVVVPRYGGFVYLASPRWVLVGNAPPAESPPQPHGALRIGKMPVVRLGSGF